MVFPFERGNFFFLFNPRIDFKIIVKKTVSLGRSLFLKTVYEKDSTEPLGSYRTSQNLWSPLGPRRGAGRAGAATYKPLGSLQTQGCTHSRNDSIKMSIEKMVFQ